LFRIQIKGRENISPDTGYIAVARHRSYWDVPVLAVAIGASQRVHFISRKGLMHGNILIQPVIRLFSTIIDRDHFGKDDFRRMLTAMKQERLIGLFPEGTTKKQVDAKAGAIRFAKLTGKRILPVNIRSEGPYPPAYPVRFPRLTVTIGEPFDVLDLGDSEVERGARTEQYRRMSEALMGRVDNA
jgi:1-acyl-sn-glycerol-3-phosphate acyltransferase